MRLIDVSDIEKFISENATAIGDDHLLLVAANDGRWHKALPLIKTAYDVNKVVKQLNNAKKYNLDLADKMLDIQANGTTRHFICLEEAIEIVKQGGVSDDVCEPSSDKIKVTSLEVIATGSERKPQYEIKYKELGADHYNIGYSSYNLDFVLDWKEKYFELVKVVEQMIEEEYCYCHYDDTDEQHDCLDYMGCEECPYYYADLDQESD